MLLIQLYSEANCYKVMHKSKLYCQCSACGDCSALLHSRAKKYIESYEFLSLFPHTFLKYMRTGNMLVSELPSVSHTYYYRLDATNLGLSLVLYGLSLSYTRPSSIFSAIYTSHIFQPHLLQVVDRPFLTSQMCRYERRALPILAVTYFGHPDTYKQLRNAISLVRNTSRPPIPLVTLSSSLVDLSSPSPAPSMT